MKKLGLVLIPILVLMIIPVKSFETVEMYSTELSCPIDSFDFAHIFIEFDTFEMCEVSGNIIYMASDAPTGGGGVNLPNQPQEPTPIIIQIQQNNDTQPAPLKNQLDSKLAKVRADLKTKLTILIKEKIALQSKISNLKQFIDNIIIELRGKLDKLSSDVKNTNIKLDDILTRKEIEDIVRRSLNAQFILSAYAETNTYDLQSKISELIETNKNIKILQQENHDLKAKADQLELDLKKLQSEKIKIDDKIRQVVQFLGENIKKFTDDIGKKIQSIPKPPANQPIIDKNVIDKGVKEAEKTKDVIVKNANDWLGKIKELIPKKP